VIYTANFKKGRQLITTAKIKMATLILNYFGESTLVTNAKDAVEFINSLNGISANNSAVKNLENYFSGENPFMNKTLKAGYAYEIATTGCGSTRIMCYRPLATTLEGHNQVLADRKAQAEKEKNDAFQAKMNRMYESKKGNYVVQLDCFELDNVKGGHKARFTNWKVLADSPMDAYNKAVCCAEEKRFFWCATAEKCQIDFIGEWTDLTEEIYNK